MYEQTLNIGTELNRQTSKQLRKALQSTLQHGHSVCFDASRLRQADAGGLSELFSMVAEVLERGGEAFISGAAASMHALFELVQLDQVAEMRTHEVPSVAAHAAVHQLPMRPAFAGLRPQMAS